MPGRFEFERAIRLSDLAPLSRLVALTLATWADQNSGTIPAKHQPSLSTLEAATGMSHGAMLTHLDKLEVAGWIKRDRPTAAKARSQKARTKYRLRLPTGSARDLVTGSGDDPAGSGGDLATRSGDDPVLGQEMTTGLGQELTTRVPIESLESQKQAGEPAGADSSASAIPEFARPLVDGLTANGVIVRWPFTAAEWLKLHAVIKRVGIPAMVEHARKVATRTSVESARYFIRGWVELPPIPAADTERPALRAVAGGWQPFQNPTNHDVYDEDLI